MALDYVSTENAIHAKIESSSHSGIKEGYVVGLNSSGETVLACAGSGANVEAFGFAQIDGTYGSTDQTLNRTTEDHLMQGRMGGFSGLTPGLTVYVSTTAGGVTQTKPTGAGEFAQKVGGAYTSTNIVIKIGTPIYV